MSISFDFSGRTALVTGGAQGIGRAIAAMFHDAGAHVAVLDRSSEALADAWPASARVATHAIDVTDTAAVGEVVRAVEAWTGRIDIAVNNAGITRDRVVWKLGDEEWQDVLDVHLGGTFAVTRAVVPVMRAAGYGRIINVTSYTGLHGTIGQSNYAAAKGGIIAFTKTVAKETARFGITVNAISPNAATPMVTSLPVERIDEMTEMVPVGRFAEPEEMATAIGYLAAEQSSYVTGVVLPVDGGLAM
ncbi:SDR family oxidoreductase [Nocardioides sp.]|uniref:SDR family oxidoreductase n=1 Tax=Nocardioides sp. TaxID=35761 RepID=UPI00260E1C5C|nr:SDR family oxidoreductase [Nocardioides sp.]MDI6909236.1 SDR family oxidoreductase [Nocardioides sp.]